MVEAIGYSPVAEDMYQLVGVGSESRIKLVDYLTNVKQERGLSFRGLSVALGGVDHSALNRLINRNMDDVGLTALTTIAESAGLSDQTLYEIVLGSLPERIVTSEERIVYKDTAPVLTGSFGDQLRRYRKQRHMSLRTLAARVTGINPLVTTINRSTIIRLETKPREPFLSTFAVITYALGLNPAQVRGLVRAVQKPSSQA